MGDDAENFVGAVRTYVNYRDHHYFDYKFPGIIQKDTARPKIIKSNAKSCIEHMEKQEQMAHGYVEPDGPDGLWSTENQNPKDPTMPKYTKGVEHIAFKECPNIFKNEAKSAVKKFYGPFQSVFNEKAGSDAIWQKISEPMYDKDGKPHEYVEAGSSYIKQGDGLVEQLITKRTKDGDKPGINLTFFGFGFSGSGKTYILTENDQSLLQRILKYIATDPKMTAKNFGGKGNKKAVKKVSVRFYDLAPGSIKSEIYGYNVRERGDREIYLNQSIGKVKLKHDEAPVDFDFSAASPSPQANPKIKLPRRAGDNAGEDIKENTCFDSNICSFEDVAGGIRTIKMGKNIVTAVGQYSRETHLPAGKKNGGQDEDDIFEMAKKPGPNQKAAISRLLKDAYKSDIRLKAYEPLTLYDEENTEKYNPEDINERLTKSVLEITKERLRTYRISPTPNNPTSSEAHLFIEINITDWADNVSKLIVCDMAGSENTQQIKDDFFAPKRMSLLKMIGVKVLIL